MVFFGFLLIEGIALATNGDNLIGIGPVSRSMGGVGLAAPQDAISAVFANPAAMCFCPGSVTPQLEVATTLFFPTVHAHVQVPAAGIDSSAKSRSTLFLIPALGFVMPLDHKWRFGMAAYGVSGMGVDYRNRLDINPAVPGHQGDIFSQYQVMKLAPNIAYLINDNFSLGASFHLDYAVLDFGSRRASNYAVGLQLGTIYKIGPVFMGLSYSTPQTISHEDVYDFAFDGIQDTLKLELPQIAGLGLAYKPSDYFLIEANSKWINWADAIGYKDFDWRNQWVYGLGVQYKPAAVALRAGFNYGRNPVKAHNTFDSDTTRSVEGINVPAFNYEYLRVIGFPAITETHVTFGAGYEFSKKLSANIGYTHGFKNTISETGSNFGGQGGPNATITSDLKEDSFELGVSLKF